MVFLERRGLQIIVKPLPCGMQNSLLFLFILVAGLARGQQLPENDPTRDNTFITVEQMPQFPGGQDSLLSFIRQNLNYPEKASDKGIQGKVLVSFIVDKSGKVRDVELKRGVDPLLDAEALRVIRLLPHWVPGMQDGKAVNVSYVLPLNFKLDL
jgi:TonB family protein